MRKLTYGISHNIPMETFAWASEQGVQHLVQAPVERPRLHARHNITSSGPRVSEGDAQVSVRTLDGQPRNTSPVDVSRRLPEDALRRRLLLRALVAADEERPSAAKLRAPVVRVVRRGALHCRRRRRRCQQGRRAALGRRRRQVVVVVAKSRGGFRGVSFGRSCALAAGIALAPGSCQRQRVSTPVFEALDVHALPRKGAGRGRAAGTLGKDVVPRRCPTVPVDGAVLVVDKVLPGPTHQAVRVVEQHLLVVGNEGRVPRVLAVHLRVRRQRRGRGVPVKFLEERRLLRTLGRALLLAAAELLLGGLRVPQPEEAMGDVRVARPLGVLLGGRAELGHGAALGVHGWRGLAGLPALLTALRISRGVSAMGKTAVNGDSLGASARRKVKGGQ